MKNLLDSEIQNQQK